MLSKMLAFFTRVKLLNNSIFFVTAVWAATAVELEIGIDPAVESSKGQRNFSNPFSRRSSATSLGRTPKILDSSIQHGSEVPACASRRSITARSRAGADAAPDAP